MDLADMIIVESSYSTETPGNKGVYECTHFRGS